MENERNSPSGVLDGGSGLLKKQKILSDIMLEVCVDSLESANNAINAGADEIELCSSLIDGGLTPSMGLVHEVLALLKKQPVNSRPKLNVMLRCRGGDDFFYSDYEMQHMLSDLEIFKEMGVDKFVFGALTDNQEIDEEKCMTLLAAAGPKPITFSRAFDHTREHKRSAGILAGLGFHRVLTAGQKASVNHKGAMENISYLANRYLNEDLIIMPGGGVNIHNVGAFIKMGCKYVHSTCRSTLQLPRIERLHKLGVSDSECVYFSDYDVIRQTKEAIAAAIREKETE